MEKIIELIKSIYSCGTNQETHFQILEFAETLNSAELNAVLRSVDATDGEFYISE